MRWLRCLPLPLAVAVAVGADGVGEGRGPRRTLDRRAAPAARAAAAAAAAEAAQAAHGAFQEELPGQAAGVRALPKPDAEGATRGSTC